jgi:hypothetical protein
MGDNVYRSAAEREKPVARFVLPPCPELKHLPREQAIKVTNALIARERNRIKETEDFDVESILGNKSTSTNVDIDQEVIASEKDPADEGNGEVVRLGRGRPRKSPADARKEA